jgi:hypothetical protein
MGQIQVRLPVNDQQPHSPHPLQCGAYQKGNALNRSTIFGLVPAGLAFLAVACGDAGAPSKSAYSPSIRSQAEAISAASADSVSTASTAGAPNACVRDLAGAVSSMPDACPNGGAPRVLVRLDADATCASVLAALQSSIVDVRGAYQFASAPSDVKDHFCVFDSPSGGASAVPSLLSALCAWDLVDLAAHDCSTDPIVPSPADPNSYIAPQGQITSSDPGASDGASSGKGGGSGVVIADGESPHPCDACAAVKSRVLFVTIPPDMIATKDAVMVARFLDPALPDLAVKPPIGAQSFTVSDVAVTDGTPVRVYAPGTIPPAK